MRNLATYTLMMAIAILFAACGEATIEGAQSRFNSNIAKLNSLANKMPKYSVIMEDRVTELRDQMLETEGIADEKEKIKAIGRISSTAFEGSVAHFLEIEKSILALERDIQFLNNSSRRDKIALPVVDQIKNAESLIQEIKRDYSNTNYIMENKQAAIDEAFRYVKFLRDAKIPIEKTVKSAREKERKNNQKSKSNKKKDKKKKKS